MTEKRIPIDNVYYLLCYAWNHVSEQDIVGRSELAGVENVYDLLAKVLARGTFRLARKGIDRGYLGVSAQLRAVRGKINVAETVKQALRVRSQVACEYEELSYDVLHNQILRSTLQSLLWLPSLDVKVRAEVFQAYVKLSEVTVVELNRKLFQLVLLDPNRRYYRFLLSICLLIYDHLVVDEVSGLNRFVSFSEDRMWALFEDFIIAFYRQEQNRFTVNKNGRTIAWDDHGTFDHYRQKIPSMVADVLLDSPDRHIVLDAKYYENALTGLGQPKLRSEHLYQILAYLRNREAANPLDHVTHDGILLYPTVDVPISIEVKLEGFRIQAKSINLAQDWRRIHDDMLKIIE